MGWSFSVLSKHSEDTYRRI